MISRLLDLIEGRREEYTSERAGRPQHFNFQS
jgi:hypothetical protein